MPLFQRQKHLEVDNIDSRTYVTDSRNETIAEGCQPLFSFNLSGSDAWLPTDLSGKDDSNIVPDIAFQFPTKAIGYILGDIVTKSLICVWYRWKKIQSR